MDPWGGKADNNSSVPTKFEDNFEKAACEKKTFEKLEDSSEYLAVLERKLKAVRSKNKVLENLSAYRADCIERLMRDGCDLEPVIGETDLKKLIKADEKEE